MSEQAGRLFMDGTKLNRHVQELAKWERGEWFAPVHMEISLTNVCNQHCQFCYIDWSHGKAMMPEDMLENLIRDGKRMGIKSGLLAGEGEPTLNKAYVRACEVAGEVGFDLALNSNCVHMKDEEIERFLPHLSWMRCSVQAPEQDLYDKIHTAKPGHFDRAMRNIARCCEMKAKKRLSLKIGVQQVLLAENAHTVAKLARLAKEMGADYYVIKPCHPHDLGKLKYEAVSGLVHRYREILEEAESLTDENFTAVVRWNFLGEAEKPRNYNRCLGLPFIIQIGSSGAVYTCYPQAHLKEHTYGNLRDHSIEEIMRSEHTRQVQKWAEKSVDVHKCMPTCRQHNVNKYLWWLKEETPAHLNFI